MNLHQCSLTPDQSQVSLRGDSTKCTDSPAAPRSPLVIRIEVSASGRAVGSWQMKLELRWKERSANQQTHLHPPILISSFLPTAHASLWVKKKLRREHRRGQNLIHHDLANIQLLVPLELLETVHKSRLRGGQY
jgi:hypothetical protein